MFENEKKAVLDTALEIKRNHLISLCGGNISVRLPDGTFLVTPSGMIYEDMVPDDVVRVNGDGIAVEAPAVPAATPPPCFIFFKRCHGSMR